MAVQAAETRLDQLIRLWAETSEEDRLKFLHWQETGVRDAPFSKPLVKEDHLYLFNWRPARATLSIEQTDGFRTHTTADELAFARAFRRVWGAIPREEREQMLHYLRPDPSLAGPRCSPVIQLVDDKSIFPLVGLCKDGGRMLLFAASLTTLLRYQLAHTIAHELAHVFRHAAGDSFKLYDLYMQDTTPRPDEGSGGGGNRKGSTAVFLRAYAKRRKAFEKANEKETDQVAKRWGFPKPRMPKHQEPW